MKRILLVLAAILCLGAPNLQAQSPITLDDIAYGKYRARGAGWIAPLSDGEHYARLSDNRQAILRYSYKTGELTDTLFNAETAKGESIQGIDGFEFNAQGTRILLWTNSESIYRRSSWADHYVYDCRRNTLEKLSDQGRQRDACFSPDGRMVAFGRDNNLYIKKLDFHTEVAVTTDGKVNHVINGVSDWLYEEEFMTTRMYEWTADSKYLVFVRFDESAVKEYSFQRYCCGDEEFKDYAIYPGEYRFKYPSAGEDNSKVSLHAYNVQLRTLQQMNLPVDGEDYLPYLRATCQPSQMAVLSLNRHQNVFKMYYVNPKANLCQLVLSESNQAYVDPEYLSAIQFTTKDFTYVSEKDGSRQLYLYNLNGTQKAQLTRGQGELLEYYGRDTVANLFYYQAVDDKPYRQVLCRCDAKGRVTRLSQEPGCHNAQFDQAFHYYIDSYSNLNTPRTVSLHKADGKLIRTLQDNAALKARLDTVPHAQKSFIEVPAADGTPLYGWIIKPLDFDESKQYPLMLVQYSGPNSQQALDNFGFDWEYFLAQEGYVVACVDGRGTAARGEQFRKQTYLKLGQMESADQTAVAKALGSEPWIDASRIGIWGWSYGGYMTLLVLTQEEPVFKAGISIAPVTDYHYYNTAYTERFMRRPQENPDGYAFTSIMNRVDNLQGNLLLIHGLADDNVRTNQTMELIDALVKAGKPFDLMLYPNKNHSILGPEYRLDLYRRWWKFVQEKL